MVRKRSKKKASDILKLKLLLEEKEIVEDELSIGAIELNDILREFSKSVIPDQKSKFEKFFFGKAEPNPQKDNQALVSTGLIPAIESHEEDIKKSKKDLPDWVKQVYKKVVQRTHPDRYIGFPVKEIKEKFIEIYRRAVRSLEEGDVGSLLLCAYETELQVDNPEAVKYIEKSIQNHTQALTQDKNKIGYQWYHLPDESRMHFLENYLRQLGYVFEKKKAEDIVGKRLKKRKVGTRPEKMRVNRKKIN